MGDLANAYQAAGRPGEALRLYESVLADRERVLGPDHPNTLISRSSLAVAYLGIGQATEALTLLQAPLRAANGS
jgi:tetratricopeptide (TPR) repeat protein